MGTPGCHATRRGEVQIFNSLWLGKNPLSHPTGFDIWGITPTSTPNIISGALYEREHQGQIGVRSGSDDDSDDNGDNHYDDDYDDDAYTDTKAVLMMLLAIMIVGMRDGVNIEKDDDDSDDRSL